MPTYLYECGKCGRFEEFQSIKEDSLEECPKCSAAVRRIMGAPGIIFKGSGFYSTDAKSSSNTIKSGETKSEENKSEKKDEKKSKTEKNKKSEKVDKKEKVS